MVLTLNSAADLGNWLHDELQATPPDVNHMLRVIARETDRWFLSGENRAMVPQLVEEPISTGDPRWDALLEGVVAYRMHIAGMKPPEWTRRTKLEIGWNPEMIQTLRRLLNGHCLIPWRLLWKSSKRALPTPTEIWS